MPHPIFKGRVLAAAGPLPDQFTVDKLKQWTALRKGVFSESLDAEVTHLLCTREQFDKKVPRIREALARGKGFHIVHYDWFAISTACEKKQPERDFSMRRIQAKKNAAKRDAARIERGRKEGEKAINTNLFHLYTDREAFTYKIDLMRETGESGELGQRYTLCLWESNAKPHLYWFTAKFLRKKGDNQPSFHRPSRCSGKWHQEMHLFAQFFHIKTGIEWQDRVLRAGTMPASLFQYSPPTRGKPVGRRLRFPYEQCLEENARLRGLPWPPDETPSTSVDTQTAPPNAGTKSPNADRLDEKEHTLGNGADGRVMEAKHDAPIAEDSQDIVKHEAADLAEKEAWPVLF